VILLLFFQIQYVWTPTVKLGNPNREVVRKAQVDIANADPRGAWADCDDLNNKEKYGKLRDDLHYTKEGYELLGRRFAQQAELLVEGKKPAADGKPSEQPKLARFHRTAASLASPGKCESEH